MFKQSIKRKSSFIYNYPLPYNLITEFKAAYPNLPIAALDIIKEGFLEYIALCKEAKVYPLFIPSKAVKSFDEFFKIRFRAEYDQLILSVMKDLPANLIRLNKQNDAITSKAHANYDDLYRKVIQLKMPEATMSDMMLFLAIKEVDGRFGFETLSYEERNPHYAHAAG